MTREEAIDILKNTIVRFGRSNGKTAYAEALQMAIKALEEPQWIPCERELPEVGRDILISVGGIYTAEGCLRDDGDWAQFRWDAIQRKDMVGAWMPLPEPWRGDAE